MGFGTSLLRRADAKSSMLPPIGSEQETRKLKVSLKKLLEAALREYADVLEKGSSVNTPRILPTMPSASRVTTLTESVQKAIEQNEGRSLRNILLETKDIKVLRTADGGALIVGEIRSVWTRTAGGNRKSMPASEGEKPLCLAMLKQQVLCK